MKMAGQNPRRAWKGRAIAVVIVLLGAAALWYAYDRSSRYPSTDDASIDADVVHVASPVGGRIIRVPVEENQHVAKGDVLFEIDPVPYRLAVAQAQAEVELARASLATRRRTLIGETSNATIAADQTRRATHNYDLATRSVERLRPLEAQGYVSAQQLDQAVVAQRDASVSLAQAKVQQHSSAQTVGDDTDAIAALHAREAALAIAQRGLDDTVVRAPFDGYVTGLTILAGETVAPNQSIFTLVHSGEWFAVANFRETALGAIEVGDCATVYSMIDRRQPMSGKVIGIGAGIMDTDRVNLPRSLPYVQQSVNWVRVAQRFPVRVRIDAPVNRLVRIGASAIVEVRHGQSCR
ncbi:multidrug transporter subunit MdtN [Paraburkholderia sp. CNPSo 3272]|uniref:multidrug transporter subunit MdtN n=1 Tax=Paraburkholderia sp. CNPSo 3272 TaxID=2940931 RepID=UPI0020B64151|nr:multidrug transporter subunit MdtN [Paraburkholderia sp. CNPSo 3272]MCP3727927.1 multidrug transporter subunit MdtN [Paraburkholderia sp. CNPSo 3272]